MIASSGSPISIALTAGSSVATTEASAATPTVSSATASSIAQTLIGANANRRGLIIKNDSPQRLYIKYGSAASLASFTDYVDPTNTWVMQGIVYSGLISGIWRPIDPLPVSGQALITEIVT